MTPSETRTTYMKLLDVYEYGQTLAVAGAMMLVLLLGGCMNYAPDTRDNACVSAVYVPPATLGGTGGVRMTRVQSPECRRTSRSTDDGSATK